MSKAAGFWWDAGFEHLVSITPPDGVIAPNSTLQQKSLGKSPGLLTSEGWVGYPWVQRTPNRDNVLAWQAGTGLRTDYFPAVDIDVLDPDLAAAIEALALDVLGPAPARVGRAPKRLLLYRTSTPMPKRRVAFGEHAVEVLGAGQQFVCEGIHPATGKRYSWGDWHPVPLGAPALTEVGPEALDRFFERLTGLLEVLGYDLSVSTEAQVSERQAIDQSGLSGDVGDVSRAVQSIPNGSDVSREDYLRMGYALKAALPDDEVTAFELWYEWGQRWEGGVNDRETMEADWRRMRGPFEIGARWLLDRAAKHGDSSHLAAKFTFEDAPPPSTTPPAPVAAAPVTDHHGQSIVVFSDAWLALRAMREHGAEMRYCQRFGGWLYWDGTRWVRDDVGLVGAWVSSLGRTAALEAAAHGLTPSETRAAGKWASSERAVAQALNYASRQQHLVVRPEEFDTDPWLLNTPGGVYDLRTGTVMPHDPSMLLTKSTLVAPEFTPPTRFLAFLEEVTAGDRELQNYIQRLFGYALTGTTREEMLAFFHGSGGNGKGTLLKTITRIMGDYAAIAPMETFTATKSDRHPTELAALMGARLVVAQETQEGRAWDEAKIKSVTGGDPITARYMHQNFFTYQPQFKLVFAGNHRPAIQSLDAAMVRRFHLVPFNVTPKVVDNNLKDELIGEYPQILGWMIEGCQSWAALGLMPPKAVLDTTQEYFRESDPIGRWIEERCDFLPTARTAVGTMFEDYRNWSFAENEDAVNAVAVSRFFKLRGIEVSRDPRTKARVYVGVGLRAAVEDVRARMLEG